MKNLWYNFINGIKNFWKWKKIIWYDKWWDFYYFEELIIFKLKDLEKHWEKDTHYVGDCFTKKRIQVLLREWKNIQKFEDEYPLDYKTEKLKQEWFKRLGKLLPKLWD